MKKLRKVLLILFSIFIIFLAGFYFYKTRHPEIFSGSDSGPAFTKVTAGRQAQYAKVKQVVDGDTIKLESGETVRYIGVNTPEIYQYNSQTKRWNKTDKCYSGEAMAKNKELVEGKVVRLEKETSDRDKFGRLLRDVWINDMMVNLELVKEGGAKVMTVPPDKKYEQQILGAQKEARENGRGLWKACN